MKPRTWVHVVWEDAHGERLDGWTDPGELDLEPRQITTVGQLIDENPKGVAVALSWDQTTENIDAYIFIPDACIVSKTDLVAK